MTQNNRPTFKQLYDEIIPMKEDITEVKTLLQSHLRFCENQIRENKEEHKSTANSLKSKISIKAFSAWLGSLSIIISIILILIGYVK